MTTKMPDEIYTLPDSQHTGTYCDVNDGGTRYIRADHAPSGDDKIAQVQKVVEILKEWRTPTNGNRALAIMIVEQLLLIPAAKSASKVEVVTVEYLDGLYNDWAFENAMQEMAKQFPNGLRITEDK